MEKGTLPETNIAPENGWLGDYFPFEKNNFQGQAVSFRECNSFEDVVILSIHF